MTEVEWQTNTTGRVVSQYLSGSQTRRIGPLVDQFPHPKLEVHPRMAQQLGIRTDDWVTIQTRRGQVIIQANVVNTIRPDTVFMAYHWGGKESANLLTQRALDPVSKIPEFKVSACRVRLATPEEQAEGQRVKALSAVTEKGIPAGYGLDARRQELKR